VPGARQQGGRNAPVDRVGRAVPQRRTTTTTGHVGGLSILDPSTAPGGKISSRTSGS
jgi:hypothetical protein